MAMVFIHIGAGKDCHAQMNTVAAEKEGETVGFDRVQPILRKRCQSCHNPEELRGELSVTDLEAIAAGSSSGPVVIAGKPRESLLYTTAAHLDEPTMPPNSRKIPGRELDVIRRWIEDGLVAKSGMSPAVDTEKVPQESVLQPVSSVLQSSSIPALAAHPSKELVAFAGNQQIAILNAQEGKLIGAIPFPESEITGLRFSRDGSLLIAAGGVPGLSGSVYGYDSTTWAEVFTALDENDSILALDLSPKNELLAIGGPSKVMRAATTKGEVKYTFKKPTDWLLTNRFCPDGLLIACGDRFGGLFVCESESGELFWNLRGHTGAVHAIAWDSDQQTLLSAGEDGNIRVWNMHHGEQTAQWDAEVGGILALGRSDSLTVAGGREGRITSWISPDAKVGTFETEEQIENIELLPTLQRLVATDSAGKVHLLTLPELEPIATLELPKQEQVMEAFLARLDEQKKQFEISEQARIKEDALSSQIAEKSTQVESPVVANSATAAAGSLAESSSSTELSSMLEIEIANFRSTVEIQENALTNLRTQQTMLETLVSAQEQVLLSNRNQIVRLETLLSAMRGEPLQLQTRTLQAQLEEQRSMLEVIASLELKSESAAKQAQALPEQSRPDWTAAREIVAELKRTLHTQATQTERQLQMLRVEPTRMTLQKVAEAQK